ncbi:MAG: hypothetical protein AB7N65_31035, partial [Vicinamibacterales bacterium]
FGIAPIDYKRFLSALRKHQCHVPFKPYRRPQRVASVLPYRDGVAIAAAGGREIPAAIRKSVLTPNV